MYKLDTLYVVASFTWHQPEIDYNEGSRPHVKDYFINHHFIVTVEVRAFLNLPLINI